jgi:Zn-dependent protease/CBS domain-containing protein
MRASIRLGRIAGIEIGVHYTWVIAFVLITVSLAFSFFPRQYPGWDQSTYWVTAVVAALLLFASVLIHELAHSLFARARGLPAHSITLFIFGGVSNLGAEAETPKDEFIVAVVGPLASLLLAGAAWGLQILLGGLGEPIEATLGYLALINAVLAIFNLLPGFPLDGGRVLRSILWATTKSFRRATRIAAGIGQLFGWMLIGLGVFMAFVADSTWGLMGGVWIALIGWFLSSAAAASRRDLTTSGRFHGVRVDQVMDPALVTVSPRTPVADLVVDYFMQQGRRALPVTENGDIVGIVTVTDARGTPRDQWDQVSVEQIMTRGPLQTVEPEDDLSLALGLLADQRLNQVLVLRGGRLVGLLSRVDIIHYLRFSEELGMGPGAGAGGNGR